MSASRLSSSRRRLFEAMRWRRRVRLSGRGSWWRGFGEPAYLGLYRSCRGLGLFWVNMWRVSLV